MSTGPYVANLLNFALLTSGAPITLVQITPAANVPVKVIGVRVSGRGSGLASNQVSLALVRMTTGATGGHSQTPGKLDPLAPAASATVADDGTTFTTMGTQSATDLIAWNPNILSGWAEMPIPEGRMSSAGGVLPLALVQQANAAVGVSCDFQVIFREGTD